MSAFTNQERFTPQSNQELEAAVQVYKNMTTEQQDNYLNQPGWTYGRFSDWDVSNPNITDMSDLFINCDNFNEDISGWNVSNVTNMSRMFLGCISFNQPLNTWNVSNVTNMSKMFSHCTSFNQPLNSWNVSNVTNMSGMFQLCRSFNQPLNSWDVSNVTNNIQYHL